LTHTVHYKNLHFTYRVIIYTYFMTYASGFVIIILTRIPADMTDDGYPVYNYSRQNDYYVGTRWTPD